MQLVNSILLVCAMSAITNALPVFLQGKDESESRPNLRAEADKATICSRDGQCKKDGSEYCFKTNGMCNDKGKCQPKGDGSCVGVNDNEICGCDGNTYVNKCQAKFHGVSVASRGQCSDVDDESSPSSSSSQTTFCETNGECKNSEYCFKTNGMCNDTGICQPKGDGTCVGVNNNKICGCDGDTYVNKCQARFFGVSVASKGKCSDDDDDVSELK